MDIFWFCFVFVFPTVVISTADGVRNPGPGRESGSNELAALNYALVLCSLSMFATLINFWQSLKVCCDDTFYTFNSTHVRKKDYKA